jgi:Ras GTPase-activating-like protein IQGAP2/3
MSSYDGSRSARQSKRYSMSALYMSISANESDLVIEDELAKGAHNGIEAGDGAGQNKY